MFGLFSFLGSILSRTKKRRGHFLVPKKRSLSGLPLFFLGGFCRCEKNKLDGVVPSSGYSSKVAKPLDDTGPWSLMTFLWRPFSNLVVGIL